MLRPVTIRTIAITLLLLLTSASLHATNGLTLISHSVRAQGMGGVTAAIPHDAFATISNPALATQINRQLDCSLSLLSTSSKFTAEDIYGYYSFFPVGTTESEALRSFIPAVAYSRLIGGRTAVAASLEHFPANGVEYSGGLFPYFNVGQSQVTSLNLETTTFTGTFAHRLANKHSFGISGIVLAQWFEVTGIGWFVNYSTNLRRLTDNGSDAAVGLGARFGYYGEISKRLHVGLSYQTKIALDKHEKYSGFLTDHGKLDVPAKLLIGLAYKFGPDITVGLDIQDILYSDAAMLGTAFNPEALMDREVRLGAEGGSGFGWDDMLVVKFGCEWRPTTSNTFRFGYSYGDQPIGSDEIFLSTLLPYVIKHHLTIGHSHRFSDGKVFNCAITYAFSGSINGENTMLESYEHQSLSLSMSQLKLAIGFSF